MSMSSIDLVVPFDLSLKNHVQTFLNEHPYKHLIKLYEDDEHVCLVINETKTQDVYHWLNQLIDIIQYDKYKEFYQHSTGNILHLYLSAEDKHAQFDLKFTAEHLLLFWQLGIIIDIDYGINFNHE